MKNLVFPAVAFNIICMLLCSQLKAQGGCTFITFSLELVEPCLYRIDYTNANECYPQLRVLISEGSYASWSANTPDGWTATLVNGGEILLTHSSGFIPIGTGSPLTFALLPGSNPILTLLWDYICPLGEGCAAEFQVEGCPFIADGCIEGFIYHECNELPFINQETLAERTVEIVDESGSLLESEWTGADGAYSFCDLPSGTYDVRVVPKDGWTPRVPASGRATITIDSSEFVEQNFGFCPDCACGNFGDMFIRTTNGGLSQILTCGNAPMNLSCPAPGQSYVVTGRFHCVGDSCADESRLDWTLTGPANSYTVQASADPYFSIPLLASYFDQAGLYTLSLEGECGSMICPCVLRFNIDCTELCPCSSEDIDDFKTRVERGFAMLYPENSCTVCFTPLALDDCETVDWYVNQAASTVGSSVGVRTFCYEFSEAGDYDVIMEVTRKKDDSATCDKHTRPQRVSSCHIPTDCVDPFIDNPGFNLGAEPGGMNSGGMSQGWSAESGEPLVVEGSPGSDDGWTIQLSGNLDTADVLSRSELICLGKGVPATCSTTVKSSKSNSSDRISGGTLKLYIGSKEVFVINLKDCQRPDCYELASIQLPVLDSSEWVEVVIPYDLSAWEHPGDCQEGAGILMRPYVFVTNDFGSIQGGENTFSQAELDNICFSRAVVGVTGIDAKQDFRIYPNPNTDEFMVELHSPAIQDISMRIVCVTGKILLEQEAVVGNSLQTIESTEFSEGIYVLQIMLKGQIIAVQKFVKQH